MSFSSRRLDVGAAVYTDFSGKITHHKITAVVVPTWSTSGIGFHVTPLVPKSSGDWIDADWFEPAAPQPQEPK
jgi:hypothetical protein